ncbi:hypothetical protein HJA76_15070 [Rhizobium bangladeshense]|uniref:hypothetical protein n=1 Tax=Rhizobium bangladeshense TaxID=1138189 RepID=UPI001C83BE4F|nr:hypothetical protein [Rhizobium bangladeshense]MBX4921012.1 hypothetical protein [Rhizobium bangladeshense]
MFAFLATPFGRWAGSIIGVLLLIAAIILGFRWWLHEHDKALLSGYVLLSEKTTAEAKAAEMERQLNAATQATEEHRRRLAAAEAAEQAAKDTLEQEISNYERTLSEKNRACAVTAADREWLLQRH